MTRLHQLAGQHLGDDPDAAEVVIGIETDRGRGCPRWPRRDTRCMRSNRCRLANRLVGILHGCLKTCTLYNEATAWFTGNSLNPPQASVLETDNAGAARASVSAGES